MVRSELTADDSLAAIRARSKFGIAMAAMIRMIATTISNSINEKPFCFRILVVPLLRFENSVKTKLALLFALQRPESSLRTDISNMELGPLFSISQVAKVTQQAFASITRNQASLAVFVAL